METMTVKQMAENALKLTEPTAKRSGRDSVFCDLFSRPEYLVQLYHALHPEDTTVQKEDLTLVTISHSLLNAQYNDLGFLVGNRLLVLVEHQSTWTLNILIRFLMYVAETYQNYIRNNNLRLYGEKTIQLPEPEFYVIYPGERGDRPETISLAKDVFGEPACAGLDVKARIIYDGAQGDIINQYVAFCRVFSEQIGLHGYTRKAVEETIRICGDQDVLKDYLMKEEVPNVLFNAEQYERELEMLKQDERAEGEARGTLRTLWNLVKKGLLPKETAAAQVNMTVDEFEAKAAALAGC